MPNPIRIEAHCGDCGTISEGLPVVVLAEYERDGCFSCGSSNWQIKPRNDAERAAYAKAVQGAAMDRAFPGAGPLDGSDL